jgi:outer membrane biosynthesis protein TonB
VTTPRERLLAVYEQEIEAEIGPGERLFRIIVILSFTAFGVFGLYLKTHNPPPPTLEEEMAKPRQVSFIIEEKKVAPVVAPRPAPPKPEPPKPEPKKAEPIDLTNKPLLAQKIEDVKPEKPPAIDQTPVRRVYGLRKVYAMGFGEGGSAAEAVIGKLGNTLNAPIDTFIPKKEELKGAVAPATTVQKMPAFKVQVQPEYTKEMRDHNIEGIVRANILVDVDGKVKKAIVLNDLGYGSKEKVYEACLKLLFEPAMRDNQPVAVWIPISFSFVLSN